MTPGRWRSAAAAGGALAALGSVLPWTTIVLPRFQGQELSVAAFFAGPRQFTLILAAVVVAGALIPLSSRATRGQGLFVLGAGGAAISLGNLIWEAVEGGGLGAIAPGVWLTAAAFALVAVVASRFMDVRRAPVPVEWKPPAGFTGPLVEGAVVLATLLIAFWAGYDLFLFDEPGIFLTLIAVGLVMGTALTRFGLVPAFSDVFRRRKVLALVLLFLVLVAFPLTQSQNLYPVRILASAGLFAAAALGLNVVVGSAGLLDLGYIAFFGIGAYIAAIFGGGLNTVNELHIPFFIVFVMACTGAGVAGVVLGAPTLRLRGDYLAIVTLGFGEIVNRIMQNLNLTHGNVGVAGVPSLKVGSFDFGQRHELAGRTVANFANYYYLELLLLIGIVFVVARVNRSRIGRAWIAVREDELAASAMGVNTIAIKLLAFGVGAFIAGGAGSIFTHLNSQASPDSFQFIESVTVLAMVVLGGMGNISGVILGAVLLVVMPEKLRFFQDQRLLLFGLALILMMRFRPEGLLPSSRRRLELKEGEGSAMGAAPGSAAATVPAAGN